MLAKTLTKRLSVSPQLSPSDVALAAAQGFKTVINNRPDGEEPGQPTSAELAELVRAGGMTYHHLPVVGGKISDDAAAEFGHLLANANGPVLAFCRTGTRSASLWALSQAGRLPTKELLETTAEAGYDLSALNPRLLSLGSPGQQAVSSSRAEVLIVGGGSAGIATAASLLARQQDLDIVLIEPREEHYYQPGWTMVGGGVFDRKSTCRTEASVIPHNVRWVKSAVESFSPEKNSVTLVDGATIDYRYLVVAPGIALDWEGIDGLADTLGKNGVTSNYSFDCAPYTWKLVQELKQGVALFTQPPMPIKCAGAPQKAMYMSCDHWRRQGVLGDITVEFHNTGGVLFGVKEYVPALMSYVQRYGIDLAFESRLIAVDGPARKATFQEKDGQVTKAFDMLHVTPPQKAPAFIAGSPLANESGYVDIDQETLQHVRYENVFGLGDGGSTPNAKTLAAARKQAPIVAENLLSVRAGKALDAIYDGYGSCPLTVERGKIVLAEFGYGGKLLPSFPKWVIDGTRAERLSWLLKSEALPWIYWNGMLKGREWLAHPHHRTAA